MTIVASLRDYLGKEFGDGAISDITIYDSVTIGLVVGDVSFTVRVEDVDCRYICAGRKGEKS